MPSPRTLLLLAPLSALLSLGSARGEPRARQDETGPRGGVDGRILDASGEPLSGARIIVRERSGERAVDGHTHAVAEVWTDGDGCFELGGLAPGTYEIDVEAPGHGTVRVGVHLPDGRAPSVAPIEVRLRARPVADTASTPVTEPMVEPESRRLSEPVSAPLKTPAGESASEPASETEALRIAEAHLALESGRLERACALLIAVETVRGEDSDIFFAVGDALLRAGETDDALTLLEEAIVREPAHVEARYRRALGLLSLGRRGEARQEFARVLELREEGSLADGARTALERLGAERGGE